MKNQEKIGRHKGAAIFIAVSKAVYEAALRRVAIKKFWFILSAFTHLDNLKICQYAEYSHILKLPI
ncbi:MAG: hypothetical protein IJI67_06580 [Clostridia bacterium]|nr:hypothetical protein [Clostridia bacterium]